MAVLLPPCFKVPQSEPFNRMTDLVEDAKIFRAHMTLHGYFGEIAYRSFSLTLKGVIRGWFGGLLPSLVRNFEDLEKMFIMQFMPSEKKRHPMAYLLLVK